MDTPKTLVESVSLHRISSTVFETNYKPERMGNTAMIAYGGCALGAAVSTAQQDLPDGFHLYSMTGNFTGPALIDRHLRCELKELRRTRTFVTRQVFVSQRQDDGKYRLCLIALADFHAAEAATVLEFSKPPSMHYTPPEQIPSEGERDADTAVEQSQTQNPEGGFGLIRRYIDGRIPKESVNAYHFSADTKTLSTPQEHLSLTSKTSASWMKAKHELKNASESALVLSWVQDAALSFVPLVHNHLWLDDVATCSTLDFALRIFVNDLDMNDLNLRESRCITGGAGRSYSEAQMWDRRGRMVSSMTQQSILRPKRDQKANM